VVKEALGISQEEVPAFLKQIQEEYCPPLTYQDVCPIQCHRCNARLMAMAEQYEGAGVGQWRVTVINFVADLMEKVAEQRKARRPEVRTDLFAEAAAAMIRDTQEAIGAGQAMETSGTRDSQETQRG
jgi:hypothetical protein